MIRPTLPGGRKLPYVLAAVSVLFFAYGLLDGDERLALIGGIGLAATFAGFILPRLLLPHIPEDPGEPDDPA